MPVLSWDDDEGFKKLADDLVEDFAKKLEAHEARKALAAQQSGQTPSNPVNASATPAEFPSANGSPNLAGEWAQR